MYLTINVVQKKHLALFNHALFHNEVLVFGFIISLKYTSVIRKIFLSLTRLCKKRTIGKLNIKILHEKIIYSISLHKFPYKLSSERERKCHGT